MIERLLKANMGKLAAKAGAHCNPRNACFVHRFATEKSPILGTRSAVCAPSLRTSAMPRGSPSTLLLGPTERLRSLEGEVPELPVDLSKDFGEFLFGFLAPESECHRGGGTE